MKLPLFFKLALFLCGIFFIGSLSYYFHSFQPKPVQPVTPYQSSLPNKEALPETVMVHIAGQVKRPGVYTFKPGTRVMEALAAAGGPLPRANLDAVNLAAILKDGQHLKVKALTEPKPAPKKRQTKKVGANRAGSKT